MLTMAHCPECQAVFAAPDGHSIRCQLCGVKFYLPPDEKRAPAPPEGTLPERG